MSHNIDVFNVHSNIMYDYKSYVSSFINIRDEKIRTKVESEISGGRYWPEPLIQFNPSYAPGGTAEDLISKGSFNSEMKHLFSGYTLYRHQMEAIQLGNDGKDFIVTSGTGSGKSLTYIGTIFNDLLGNASIEKGIKAVIVYPMNALINSQYKEIEEYSRKYKDNTGNDFPLTFRCYTGQENADLKEEVKINPPDIILTNYMMLELILTRHQESAMRQSIYRSLKYLVFDELHTYRGRQGSDVAMLIRRIKAGTKNNIQCIGTSATMVSEGTLEEQKLAVAATSSRIFGSSFSKNQIIGESLIPSFDGSNLDLSSSSLASDLNKTINITGSEGDLKESVLANWLEQKIALEKKDGILVRRKPLSLTEIAQELSKDSSVDTDICRKSLIDLLKWINNINSSLESGKKTYLPFKIHQFIAQTGSVYLSPETDDSRHISLEPVNHRIIDGQRISFFPAVFSRVSGCEFLCVRKNVIDERFVPRDFEDLAPPSDEKEENPAGYIIPYEDEWNPEEDIQKLPETWFVKSKGQLKLKDGLPELKKEYRNRMPMRITWDDAGCYSDQGDLKNKGWFMAAPLLFDPSCGATYSLRTSERTKLGRLGSEGRSTSTTILSLAVLEHLSATGMEDCNRKLMSFTDNRQDASLQAGHFNDFVKTVRLRSAVYKALKKYGELDFSRIDQAVFRILDLNQKEYVRTPAEFPGAIRENEAALRKFLMYRILGDLKRGWRVTVPNLEQCGLLKITYQDLDENCSIDSLWSEIPFIAICGFEKRKELVYQVLDHIRKSSSLYSSEYMDDNAIDSNEKMIRETLIAPWSLDKDEKIERSAHMKIKTLKKGDKIFTASVGYQSSLGKYLLQQASEAGIDFKKESYDDFMEKLLDKMCGAGWLEKQTVPDSNDDETGIYQLKIKSIIWKPGDGETVPLDPIHNRSYKPVEVKPNEFFKNVYSKGFQKMKTVKGSEHTGQLNNADRQDREKDFRAGQINTLFCSPTMELGIDISELNVVHMRNVPPSPANYAQRSGRAGRSGQAALVFTNCSDFSPHDRHYFRNKREMIAGSVQTPRLELANEELLESHLNSVILSRKSIPDLRTTVRDIIDEDDDLKLKETISESLRLNDLEKEEIKETLLAVTEDFRENELNDTKWFSDEWMINRIESFSGNFNCAFDRWRTMFRHVQKQIEELTSIINRGNYKRYSAEGKKTHYELKQAEQERALLWNQSAGGSFSEFYPFRYLASEGFLPGYNFTRLPVRAYIPEGESGEYISRPRFVALREFGPQNVIYHKGAKYQTEQLMVNDAEHLLRKAYIAPDSGYLMTGDELNCSVSPFNDAPLTGENQVIPHLNLLEMMESRTKVRERISCEEEIRTSYGYKIETYFSVPGGMDSVKTAVVRHEGEDFLKIQYIPACCIHKINCGWKTSREEGFHMGLTTGRWKNSKKADEGNKNPDTEENRAVKLKTHDTADALYIQPIKSLNLDEAAVITLQYALKRGIESIFQVEESEIGAELMGDSPNIMIYEAAEGSLGILSRFTDDPEIFNKVISEAWDICRFDDEEYTDDASYDDLLSYYNQMFHDKINRKSIRVALEKLKLCSIEIDSVGNGDDYEQQYNTLLTKIDPSSSTEKKFLDFLYNRGLRLPDEAQKSVPQVYCKPDFFYEPDMYVFCDGSVHDNSEVRERDDHLREDLRNAGIPFIVYHYTDDLETMVERRKDLFRKVK